MTSFEKGLRILEAVGGFERDVSLADVSHNTGLDKSTVQRVTYTLHALGYLHKDPVTKRYRLGPKTLELAAMYQRADELIVRAAPLLADCNAELGETVVLAKLTETTVLCVDARPSRHPVNVTVAPGDRLPAFCTALGRAILAFLPPDNARALLQRSSRQAYTPRTTTDLPSLLRKLDEVRRAGFALINQERIVGEIAVAAPVFDHRGEVIAAAGVVAPTARWTAKSALQKLGPVVVEFARAITEAHLPPDETHGRRPRPS